MYCAELYGTALQVCSNLLWARADPGEGDEEGGGDLQVQGGQRGREPSISDIPAPGFMWVRVSISSQYLAWTRCSQYWVVKTSWPLAVPSVSSWVTIWVMTAVWRESIRRWWNKEYYWYYWRFAKHLFLCLENRNSRILRQMWIIFVLQSPLSLMLWKCVERESLKNGSILFPPLYVPYLWCEMIADIVTGDGDNKQSISLIMRFSWRSRNKNILFKIKYRSFPSEFASFQCFVSFSRRKKILWYVRLK